MATKVRTFIAVRVPAFEPLKEVLQKLSGLGKCIKTVEPGNLHVTLKFLGDTEPSVLPVIHDTIRQVAQQFPPMSMQVAGIGAFPHVNRPSVIWAGLDHAVPLIHVANLLDAELESLNFSREKRPFQPHLTLARVKRKPPPQLKSIIAQFQETEFGELKVSEIELFRSELRPEGPIYTVLHSAPLCGR